MKNADVELIHRILAGDDTAFAILVEKYQRQVHALAWRKIGDFHVAEEITQDTFLKVYQKLESLKDPDQFSGWLYVIATRRCLAWLRKKRMETESLEDMDTEMIEETAYSKYVAGEKAKVTIQTQREVVKKLLAKLKESERTVMILHYFGEMTCEEISRFLGVSPSAIKSRLSRARQRLKKEEPMIREALSNFQISANLTENIMKQVAHLNPIASSGSTPFVPWVLAASGAILIVLILGMGSQYSARFQQPYSLDQQSEMTVELIDAPIVQNSDAKPNIKNLIGKHSDTIGRGNGTEQESNQVLSDSVDYTQWQLPEGAKARLGKGNITESVFPATGHNFSTRNVAFSPDGNRLAIGSVAGIWIYDVRPGKEKELDLLTGHTESVTSVAFSPDGTTLASGGKDRKVRFWDVATGVHKTTFIAAAYVFSVVYSPDGSTIASAGGDGKVQLWDVTTSENKTILIGGFVTSVAFSPDGKTIACTTSSDSMVRLLDVQTGKHITNFEHKTNIWEEGSYVTSVAFSPDGKTIATGAKGVDRTLQLWDMHTGTQKVTPKRNTEDRINCVVFSPGGNTLAICGDDTPLHLLDAQTRKNITTFKGDTRWLRSIAFSPDGTMIASTGSDRTVRLWNARTGQCITTFARYSDKVSSLAYSPDGKTIVAGNGSSVYLWNANTRKRITTFKFKEHTWGVTSVTFSPDGKTIATGGRDNRVRLWDTRTRKNKTTIEEGHAIAAVAFSPDGTIIATACSDKTVLLWDVATGEHKTTLTGHTQWVNCVTYSADGSILASGGWDNTVRLWDMHTEQHITTLNGHTEAVNSIMFSPDGTTLASASNDLTVRLWDAKTGKHITTLKGHKNRVHSVTYSPDSAIITTGSADETVRLWDAHTGKYLATLEGHTQEVTSVAFSPDGTTITSGSDDGTILLWEIR